MSKKYFRLTEAQKNILSAEQYHILSSVNNNIFTLQFKNANVPKLIEAVKSFIRDTQALRLVLVDSSSDPDEALQYEREFVDEEIKIIRMKKPDRELPKTNLIPRKKCTSSVFCRLMTIRRSLSVWSITLLLTVTARGNCSKRFKTAITPIIRHSRIRNFLTTPTQ